MKKVILITNADSNWTVEYISRVFDGYEAELKVAAVVSLKNTVNSDFYEARNIKVYTYYSDSIFFISRWRYRHRLINRIKSDIVTCETLQVNLITLPALNMLSKLWNLAPKHILTFWGSDILRVGDRVFEVYRKYFDRVDSINLLTDNMYQRMVSILGHDYDDKTTVFDFGCPMYEAIDEVRSLVSKAECKEYWGISADDYVVPVGYNSIPEQQHIKIIDSIKNIDDELKQKIIFVLHFCYGIGDDSHYLQEVINYLKANKLKYIVIDRYLDKKETSILRLAADIFLYAQTTDALSASVIEYLYSGCVLVKPDWLGYPELDSRNVKYISYADFDGLQASFEQAIEVIEDKDKLREYQNNRDILWNMNSWDVVAPKWRAIYED